MDQEHRFARYGRIGSSECDPIRVGGKGMETLAIRKVAEKLGFFPDDNYESPAMARGTELEPIARLEYERQTFSTVKTVFVIPMGDWACYSPDGLVGDTGLVEIKCPELPNFLDHLRSAEIPQRYYSQMQWGLMVTGRDWCDYVVYHPEYELQITRVNRDNELIDKFKTNLARFEQDAVALLDLAMKNRKSNG